MSRFGLNKLIVTTFLPFFFRIFTNQTVHWDFSWNVSHEERLFQHEPVCIDSFISGCHVVFVSFGLIIWGFCKHMTRDIQRGEKKQQKWSRGVELLNISVTFVCSVFVSVGWVVACWRKKKQPCQKSCTVNLQRSQADSLGTRVTNRRG